MPKLELAISPKKRQRHLLLDEKGHPAVFFFTTEKDLERTEEIETSPFEHKLTIPWRIASCDLTPGKYYLIVTQMDTPVSVSVEILIATARFVYRDHIATTAFSQDQSVKDELMPRLSKILPAGVFRHFNHSAVQEGVW